jgi:RNA polymerase sigma-70 factor, ECF subfamily
MSLEHAADWSPVKQQDAATRLFYDLIWPQRQKVLRLAQLLTGNAAEAEDLAQETLLKAFAGIGGFAAGTNIQAWLMRILRNTRIDRLRSAPQAGKVLSLEAMESDVADGRRETRQWQHPQEILNAFSDQEIIRALGALPEEIRWTLLLVDVEGQDQAEAAEVLDVPVGTIKSRAHRGRAMLRQALLPVARQMRLEVQDG